MVTDEAIIILLASGFQICLHGELIDLDVKPYNFAENEVQDAIKSLNTEGGYSFIRKIENFSDIIL